MDNALFRPEAVRAVNRGMRGTVALYCPPYRWVVISLVVLITLASAGLFIFGSFTKYETSTGELILRDGMLTLPPPVAGTVISIPVKEGDAVEQGDVLMVLSSEVSTQLGLTRETIADTLARQRERLMQDRDALTTLSAVALLGLQESEKRFVQQKAQLARQLDNRQKQVTLARTQRDKLHAMRQKGYASNRQVEEQESNLLESQAREEEYQRQLLDIEQNIMQVRQQLTEQPLEALRQRNDIERQLGENDRALAENESLRAFEIRAPKAGTVGTIMVKTGQTIPAGQSAISILPHNAQLVARIMVDTRAIGFIEPGQRVVLRYQAFPYQKFGQQYGKVTDVSRTALSPQDVATLTGKNTHQEQQYRVLVQLDRQVISAYSRSEPLRPGMALDADFLVDRRNLYEWVLEPLYALGHNVSI